MEYKLCDDPWGQEEINAILRVMDSKMFTMGDCVAAYEKEFASRFGVKYAVMVNSGSTANLLVIASLVYANKLPRGSEIIVPAVSWSTTYAPLEQYGMKLVFADIDRETLNMDVDSLLACITDRTKMILLVNLLGNSNLFDTVCEICKSRDLLLMEDNCESLGAEYDGKKLGTFGIAGTFSTFYSHHLCTMEGGMAVTNDPELYEYMLSVRAHGWTRNLPASSSIYEKRPESFYESFNFIVPGYNLRPLEMEGAIGLEQLKKMDRMIARRRENAKYFQERMRIFPDIRIQKEIGKSSWFGFALILQGTLAGKRDVIVKELIKKGIEVRPIVAGNFTRNKAIAYMDYRIPFPLKNADEIHDHGFFIGNHSSDNQKEIDYFIQVLHNTIEKVE